VGRKGAPQNSQVQGGQDSETGPRPSYRDEQGCRHERQQQQRDAFSDLSSHLYIVSKQMGAHAAAAIIARLRGAAREIGRKAAVVDFAGCA
jgi:hypothetical protein